MNTLGINAVYHDDAACIVKDGVVVARDLIEVPISANSE